MRTRRESEFQLTAVCLMVHKFLHFNFLVDYIKHFANDVSCKIPKAEAAFVHAFHGDSAAGLGLVLIRRTHGVTSGRAVC